MRRLGLLLVALAFLAGAYLLSLDELRVDWTPFAAVLVTGAAGIALVRREARLEAAHEGRQAASIETLRGSLGRVVDEACGLESEKDEIGVYELRSRIDERFRADLDSFAEAREAISHRYGLEAYARVMSSFAAGERYLNRVWSASTDGYIDEAHAYITRARDQFMDARQRLEGLVDGGP